VPAFGLLGRLFACFLLVFLAGVDGFPAHALDPGEALKDPKLEIRARAISRKLRCLVCQNQSIDDSDAPLAKDLRHLVRVRLQKGESDAQVVSYIRARYGDFVMLRPPVKPATWLLWFGPGLLFLVGAMLIYIRSRRRPAAEPSLLTTSEQARFDELFGDDRVDSVDPEGEH
jgi:cytochrome c-type biogenesis protein CcmH